MGLISRVSSRTYSQPRNALKVQMDHISEILSQTEVDQLSSEILEKIDRNLSRNEEEKLTLSAELTELKSQYETAQQEKRTTESNLEATRQALVDAQELQSNNDTPRLEVLPDSPTYEYAINEKVRELTSKIHQKELDIAVETSNASKWKTRNDVLTVSFEQKSAEVNTLREHMQQSKEHNIKHQQEIRELRNEINEMNHKSLKVSMDNSKLAQQVDSEKLGNRLQTERYLEERKAWNEEREKLVQGSVKLENEIAGFKKDITDLNDTVKEYEKQSEEQDKKILGHIQDKEK